MQALSSCASKSITGTNSTTTANGTSGTPGIANPVSQISGPSGSNQTVTGSLLNLQA
jgi:hypothetical protein